MSKSINIWSGCPDPLGAALTNPTELAFRKHRLTRHYPVTDNNGVVYPDAEAAYQRFKRGHAPTDRVVMQKIIMRKLWMYPELLDDIEQRGGAAWIASCDHLTGRTDRWTGRGLKGSMFIRVLHAAYLQVQTMKDKGIERSGTG